MKSILKSLPIVLLFSLILANPSYAEPKSDQVALDKETKTDQLSLDDVQLFSTAISEIKRYYVKPVKDKALFEDAIRGMLSGLDPHSTYLDENDFKELTETTKGEFGGLGIEVTLESGLIKVISAIDDTPAKAAGVKSGDLIIRLNEKSTKDMTLRDAVNMMRGKKGTKIILTILRKDEKKPLEISIVRDIIQIKSVKSKLYDGEYGYVRLSHFQQTTSSDLTKAINDLKQQSHGNLKGLILDLRNNPGGLLDSSIEVANTFLQNSKSDPQELIVYTKGRLPGSEFTAKTTPGDLLHKAPMVVLINEGSASASEIVAGALKDNHRAIIVGTKSFGKGSVQTVLPLGKNRGIKLTTAFYYTPSGVSIQAEGITPDIVVEDIHVPKSKKEESDASLELKEADLKGHFENANKKSTDPVIQKENDENLVYDDYQLNEALGVLKGLVLLQESKRKFVKNTR